MNRQTLGWRACYVGGKVWGQGDNGEGEMRVHSV